MKKFFHTKKKTTFNYIIEFNGSKQICAICGSIGSKHHTVSRTGLISCVLQIIYICIMLTKQEIITTLKEIKPFLSKEFAVKEIGLFGSFSSETNLEESDIDLLVELERPIGWKFFSLELFLENKFGRKIDLVTKNALKKQLKENILKEVLYI